MPSSGRASSNASIPPNRLPTLPTRMQLVLSSNQVLAVDADLRLERLRRDVPGARPDVGDPPDAVLEPGVGVADHRRVEAGAGHHAEPLAVDPADVDRAPRAVEPGLAPLPRCPSGCRGSSRAGSPCPRARSRAGSACRRGRRCSAARCRRRPRRRRARRPPRAPASPASAPCGSSAPRTRADRRRRRPRGRAGARRARRRSSCRRARRRRRVSSGLRRFVAPGDRRAGDAAGEDHHDDRRDADRDCRRARRSGGACRGRSATARRSEGSRARSPRSATRQRPRANRDVSSSASPE